MPEYMDIPGCPGVGGESGVTGSGIESDPLIVCSVTEPTDKFVVHPRYEEGVLVGWFNSAGTEVVEGVDFVVCAKETALEIDATTICADRDGVGDVGYAERLDRIDPETGETTVLGIRDEFGVLLPSAVQVDNIECENCPADTPWDWESTYYRTIITNVENGTPTEYAVAVSGSALPVVWLEEDGTRHEGTSFSATYNDDGPRDVFLYIPQDVNISTELHASGESVTALSLDDPNITTLIADHNLLTEIDLTNLVNLYSVVLNSNQISSIIEGLAVSPFLTWVYLTDNKLSVDEVNQALVDVAATPQSLGDFNSANQTPPAPPSGAGLTARDVLQSRFWNVTTD